MTGIEAIKQDIYTPFKKQEFLREFEKSLDKDRRKFEKHAREIGRMLCELKLLPNTDAIRQKIKRIEENQQSGEHTVAFFKFKLDKTEFLKWLRERIDKVEQDDNNGVLGDMIDCFNPSILKDHEFITSFQKKINEVNKTSIFLEALSDYFFQTAKGDKK